MYKLEKIIGIICWMCWSVAGFGQTFSSVKCVPANDILGNPVIRLNSEDKLFVSFDEISSETRSLEYRFVLCNADWKPASLLPIQYIRGMPYTSISDIRFSLNTRTDYTHYEFSFPDDYTQLLVSGNYKCEIYDVYEPETTLLTLHFFVTENTVAFNGKVFPPKRVEFQRNKQELQFEITALKTDLVQPYQNLTVLVQQNSRVDNVRKVQPQYIVGKTLKFSDSEDLIFDGGNEFRNFDTRFLTHSSGGVENISVSNGQYWVQTYLGESTATKVYSDDDDLNGKFAIHAEQTREPALEAEYTLVYFSLASPQIAGANVYLFGELTDWAIDEYSEMTYNFEKNCYEKTLFLKQGFYDYQYVLQDKNSQTLDITRFEGNHQETRNDYTLYVYYRGSADSHDRLIGTTVIKSRE